MEDELEQEQNTGLNLRQERFCQLYATDVEFFGNGVESYADAYDHPITDKKSYMVAAAAASRLLKNVKVLDRINSLLEEGGLNDVFIDKQLKFLITQHADLFNKLGAIKEYNKLKQRIVEKKKIEVTLPKPIDDVLKDDSLQEDQAPEETD